MLIKSLLSFGILFITVTTGKLHAQTIPVLNSDTCLIDAFQDIDELVPMLPDTMAFQIDSLIVEGDCDSVKILMQAGNFPPMEAMQAVRQDSCNIALDYGLLLSAMPELNDTVVNVCDPLINSTPLPTPPTVMSLSGQPNPFQSTISMNYSIRSHSTQNSQPVLHIFTAGGALVLRAALSSLSGTFVWDGKDAFGNPVPPGTYQAVLKAGTESKSLSLTRSR